VFDVHLKRARALHAHPDTLSFVPPWYGERVLALVEARAASIGLTGPVAPHLMDGIDPALASRDMLPRVHESAKVVDERKVNWTGAPCPTPGWAQLVHPELGPDAALTRLWDQIAHVLRLDEPDPIAAWETRFKTLREQASKLTGLGLDSLRFEGPGTDLTIGLFASSCWMAADFQTVDGIRHAPNLPTEEVFTTPDPERVEGVVRATKPLFTSGRLLTGLSVEFRGGRAVRIDAEEAAETLRGLSQRDAGAARLGEVALVDRESRIGRLGTVFYDTLLDENAASHIALGNGLPFALQDDRDRQRMNLSEIHIDFMIGADEVAVTGITRDAREVPLLRDGAWQL
jgi:aminopeptidase